MKRLCLLFFVLAVAGGALGQTMLKNEFSLSVGYLHEGTLYVWETDREYSFGESGYFKGEFVHYFSDAKDLFGIGAFYMVGWPYYSGLYEEVTMHEIGLLLKGRIPTGTLFHIKPGLGIAYRGYSGDEFMGYPPGKGLAIDLSVQGQFAIWEKAQPFIDIGFITQPTGGNDYSEATYGPVLYTGLGVSF